MEQDYIFISNVDQGIPGFFDTVSVTAYGYHDAWSKLEDMLTAEEFKTAEPNY